jgi:hypothetical protein
MIFARLSRHLGFSKFVTPVEPNQQFRSPISMVYAGTVTSLAKNINDSVHIILEPCQY